MDTTPYKKATKEDALRFMSCMWYIVAQKTVEHILEVVDGLDEEKVAALKSAALRPMDFKVEIESAPVFDS